MMFFYTENYKKQLIIYIFYYIICAQGKIEHHKHIANRREPHHGLIFDIISCANLLV